MSWKGNLRKAGIVSDNEGLSFEDPVRLQDYQVSLTTVSTITAEAAATFTIAQLLGGLILRDPNGAARADKIPTAALVIAGITGCAIGDSFEFVIKNTANAAETITVTTNDGDTLVGTMTIVQNNSKRFKLVVTGVSTPAYTLYSLGTFVH